MNARQIAQGLAAGRVAMGASLLLAPRLVGAAWLGADARLVGPQVMGRAMGARDLALGLGALAALRSGAPVKPWLLAGALADLADAGATLAAGDELPVTGRLLALGMATSATAFGGAAAARLD